jgi:tripeptide aminopeptidase
MGLLTPNLFDGSMNFHGKKEWIPLEWMEKSVETMGHLLDIWVEKAAGGERGTGDRAAQSPER